MAGPYSLDEAGLKRMVVDFYAKADAGAPLVELLPCVDAETFHMVWTPTCQFDGAAGFEEFYRNLTQNVFDRQHDVSDIQVEVAGDTARVTFFIHLTARCWYPPAPKSLKVRNKAGFEWRLKLSATTGQPVITSYVLTSVHFFEDSMLMVPEMAFMYPKQAFGPLTIP